jgi:tetratricopeptide (TPR) repeat protein
MRINNYGSGMVKRGRHDPDRGVRKWSHARNRMAWRGARQPSSVPGIGAGFYRYAVCGLVASAFVGILLAGVIGCGTAVSGSGGKEGSGAFVASLRRGPGEVDRLLRNVHYFKLMGRPELALKELEQAHRQDPGNPAIVDALAWNYEELGNFEAARKLYQEALTQHGPQPVLANNLCFSYYRQERWEEAEACFRETLARHPQNMAARNNLGLLYCRLGRLQEARRLWQDAEDPTAADQKMGQVLGALGMKDSKVYAEAPRPTPPPRPQGVAPARPAALSPPPAVKPEPGRTAANPLPPKGQATALAVKSVVQPAVPDAAPVAKMAPGKALDALSSRLPAKPARAQSAAPLHLTCADLLDNAIEVRNGTRTQNLAHDMRALLSQEGFTVAIIGNHVDFGAEKTIIYYRPGAEKIAQALGGTIFSGTTLEPSQKLNNRVAVKILLGTDLLERSQLMARLAGEE